mgnify:FL=1
MIIVKSDNEIEFMRKAGHIVATVLHELESLLSPGVTTRELDKCAERQLSLLGAESPFKGYRPTRSHVPFPGVTCMSVNSEIVHGVPSERQLSEGDILTIDCGAVYEGWMADSAWTFPVGEVSDGAIDLLDATKKALYASIESARAGNRTGDIAETMQKAVESRGYNVIRHHTSHGIGRSLHEDPQILNHGSAKSGPILKRGMTIALEPMVLAGHYDTQVMNDQWTVSACDGGLTAHFEHTIAITDDDAEILTRIDSNGGI